MIVGTGDNAHQEPAR